MTKYRNKMVRVGISSYLGETGLRNLEFVRTGDILLFGNEPQKGSLIIMSSTGSRWTHIGVAVWRGDNLMVFESTYGSQALDDLTGEVRRGVRLANILDVKDKYNMFHVRKTTVERTPEFYTKLEEFMELWKGKNYVTFYKIPLIPYLCFEDPGVSCGELVARFFDYVGEFDGKPNLQNKCIKNFLPAHFAPDSPDLDTSKLFSTTLSPLIFQKPHTTIESIKVLVILTMVVTVVWIFTNLIHLKK